MLWIITKDHSETRQEGHVNPGSRARYLAWSGAPAEARDSIRSTWAESCETEFRLLDADGNVCYEGVCHDLDNQDGDSAFEPLDWAEGLIGATSMQYGVKGSAGWREL